MFGSPRIGSGKIATGRRLTSELSPGAWPVDEPSKFHSGRSASLILPSSGTFRIVCECDYVSEFPNRTDELSQLHNAQHRVGAIDL
jgi:hypothetical protein